jgi:hypothetical protein
MKRLFILAFFWGVTYCQTVTLSDTASSAFLTVHCGLPELPVYLDSLQIGRTPLENYEIVSGIHRLMVASPYGVAWNADNYIQTFTVSPGEKVEFDVAFAPNVVLNTIPYGAAVFENAQLLGTTPLRIQPRAPTVRIEKEGYESQEILLESLKGSAHIIQMTPNARWFLAQQKMQNDHQSKLKWRKRLMFGSLALAAVTGFTTVHFRSRGNDAYADYMATAIPADMDRYYAKSREYDKYAGISYIIFEMGFMLTGYFFLSSRQ